MVSMGNLSPARKSNHFIQEIVLMDHSARFFMIIMITTVMKNEVDLALAFGDKNRMRITDDHKQYRKRLNKPDPRKEEEEKCDNNHIFLSFLS